jgi:4-amino-4-deoxy-L-arabinose transferase-like glycosyltransferase
MPAMPTATRPWRIVLALVGLGLLVLVPVIVLVATRDFAGLYGQDAFGYANYTFDLLRPALAAGRLPPDWPQPPGFPMVVAAISLVLGPDARLGQGVSLAAGVALPVTTAALAHEALARSPGMDGRARLGVPLLAGVVIALAGQLWQSSAVAMPDTLAALAATLGAGAVCRYARSPRAIWLVAGAAAIAFAIDTRWIDSLVAVPIALAGLVGLATVWRDDRGRALVHAGAATLVALLVLAPVGGQMALAAFDGRPVPFNADFGAYRWSPLDVLRTDFSTPDGTLVYAQPPGRFYLFQPAQSYWFGPAAVVAVLGAIRVLRRGGLVGGLVLVAWPLAVIGFLAAAPYQNPRFLLAAAPPIAILLALGAWRAWTWLIGHVPVDRRGPVTAAAAVLAIGWFGLAAAFAWRYTDAFVERQTRDLAAIRAIEARLPPDARIMALGPTGAVRFDGFADVIELFGQTPATATAAMTAATRTGRPAYLVVDDEAIATQWAGRAPALTVDALRTTLGLTPIAHEGAWSLYRVGRS